jgi:hypothetical protein
MIKPHSNKKINDLYFVFKDKYDSLNSTNWKSSLSDFMDKIITTKYDVSPKRIVTGWLSSLIEKAYYKSAHQRSESEREKFEGDLRKIIKSKKIPSFLKLPGSVLAGKRQPSFLESIDSTLDRYCVMESLHNIFGPNVSGIIIGGSMSYGAFYSVRNNKKNNDFSDIDGLVVVSKSFFTDNNIKNIFRNNSFLPESEMNQFINRMITFGKLYNQGRADLLSQRFSVIGKEYTVSLHFLCDSTFENMVYKDFKNSLDRRLDTDYLLKDFRTDSFTHPCLARHTFNGNRYESPVSGEKTEFGGYIANVPGFTISNGMYFPGIYHTVIYPSFLVFYDKDQRVTNLVQKFESLLYKEVDILRKNFPSSTYAKAHNRYDIFAPGRFEEGLNSFISPDNFSKYEPDSDFKIFPLGSKSTISFVPNKDNQKNKEHRDKIQRRLTLNKKKTLNNAENDIKIFLKNKNIEKLLAHYKHQGKKWFTVCLIKAIEKEVHPIPNPYLDKVKNIPIDSELYVQSVSAKDIMKLDSYEELSKKYGKVFVASVMDPSEESKTEPIYFALIVRT